MIFYFLTVGLVSASSVKLKETYLSIERPNMEPLSVSYSWLRDHSKSPDTYNLVSRQRIKELSEMPLNIRPTDASMDSSLLKVEWSDNTVSEYPLSNLLINSTILEMLLSDFSEDITEAVEVDCTKFMEEKQALYMFAKSVIDHGVAYLKNCNVTVEDTKKAAERIAPMSHTIYGQIWSIEAKTKNTLIERNDVADTHGDISFHTDYSYMHDANGFQVFQMLKQSEIGGDNGIMDGFKIAEMMRINHPTEFEILTRIPVTHSYIHSDSTTTQQQTTTNRYYSYTGPIFKLNNNGKVVQVRHNNYHRDLAPGPVNEMNDLYRALHIFVRLLEDPSNQSWKKLQPGTVMVLDKFRMFHARRAFQGDRELTNGFISRDRFMNAWRVMNDLV